MQQPQIANLLSHALFCEFPSSLSVSTLPVAGKFSGKVIKNRCSAKKLFEFLSLELRCFCLHYLYFMFAVFDRVGYRRRNRCLPAMLKFN
ncbi:hypothetical protein Ahy_A08g039258 isoform C [Arachis hypogaea]|uniref:Uncharacterized protein n=1 Tax=Arachis hypogaea TaxID=3818 RepID=A0A445BVS0_ARAHY|nr:hypothetical protein Ahy_A08g039258 isoform C [Arachis hypogaea]